MIVQVGGVLFRPVKTESVSLDPTETNRVDRHRTAGNRISPVGFGRRLIAVTLVLVSGHLSLAQDAESPVDAVDATSVTVDSGKLSGLAIDDNLTVFRGVPYAAPPVGDLRWKPPQPLEPWDGVRECDRFGSPAIQFNNPEIGSEDCLFLNIWTTAKTNTEKRPVMVWIHGGGLAFGRSDLEIYDGQHFARRGAVLVSINYRLGAFGFLSHPALSAESEQGVSGNYGLLDQIAALKWVQRNIAAFGGDPDNVTVFGQSAGATSIYLMTASPLADGLFHRTILQSPWLDRNVFRHLSEEVLEVPSAHSENTKRVAAIVGDKPDVLAELRKMPAKEVSSKLGFEQRVVIDGWLLPDFPQKIYANGNQNQVATIAGTNRDEGTLFAPNKMKVSIEKYERTIRNEFGDQSPAVFDLHGVEQGSGVRKTMIEFAGDFWFVHPTRVYSRSMASQGNDTWLYQFRRKSPGRAHLGSAHGSEIPFVFNTLNFASMIGANKRVSESMIGYWVRFATTGDPNAQADDLDSDLDSEVTVVWPKYTEAEDIHLVIDATIKTDTGLRKQACNVYDEVLEAMGTAGATVDAESPEDTEETESSEETESPEDTESSEDDEPSEDDAETESSEDGQG